MLLLASKAAVLFFRVCLNSQLLMMVLYLQEHPHRIPRMDQFQRKLPLSGNNELYSSVTTTYKKSVDMTRCQNKPVVFADAYRSCCTSSGSSAELAVLSRPADVSGAHSDPSMRRCTDYVAGKLIIISGYWTGPDADDGCGSVEAVLQRIG
jgi:hypothetical protein